MTSFDDRLGAALRYNAKRKAELDAAKTRTHFTPETARAANDARYAGTERKPATATIRVEADILELVKTWEKNERVAKVSAAIRAALGVDNAFRPMFTGQNG